MGSREAVSGLAQTVSDWVAYWLGDRQVPLVALAELERLAADAERLRDENAILVENNAALSRSAVGNRDGRKLAEAEAERFRVALERIAAEEDGPVNADEPWFVAREALRGEVPAR